MASDANAPYDDRVAFDAAAIEPTVTWGINPGQSVGVTEPIDAAPDDEALAFMGFKHRQRACRARASTSRSSARAPTAGCRISRKRRASCAGTTSRRT